MRVENLEQRNGYWYDNIMQKYYIKEDEKFIPAISPIHGGMLKPLKDNLFYDLHTNSYCIYQNGEFTVVKNPITKTIEHIVPTEEKGVFKDTESGHKFIYNENVKNFIPDYIPDDSLKNEPAHLEENYLVGDKTGVKIEIGKNGEILTPTYLKLKEEVEKNTPKNGIWKGHKFIYDENRGDQPYQQLLIEVKTKEEQIEYKEAMDNGTNKIEIIGTNDYIIIDEYDRQLLDKINKIISERLEKNYQEKINNEIKRIKKNSDYEVWKITHHINSDNIDEKSTNEEYLRKITEKINGATFCEFEIKEDICYFSLATTPSINHQNTMQAKVFTYTDEFKSNFLEPFLGKMINNNGIIYCDIRIVPKEKNQQFCDFYVINSAGNIVAMKNIQTTYAQSLAMIIQQYQTFQQEVLSETNGNIKR